MMYLSGEQRSSSAIPPTLLILILPLDARRGRRAVLLRRDAELVRDVVDGLVAPQPARVEMSHDGGLVRRVAPQPARVEMPHHVAFVRRVAPMLWGGMVCVCV